MSTGGALVADTDAKLERFLERRLSDDRHVQATLAIAAHLSGEAPTTLTISARKSLRRRTGLSQRAFVTSCRILGEYRRDRRGEGVRIGARERLGELGRGVLPRRYALRLPITHDVDFAGEVRGADMFGPVRVDRGLRPLHLAVLSAICALWERQVDEKPVVEISARSLAALVVSDRYEPSAYTLARIRDAVADLAQMRFEAGCTSKHAAKNFAIGGAPLASVELFDGLGTVDAAAYTGFVGKGGAAGATLRITLADELVAQLRDQRVYIDFAVYKAMPNVLAQRVYVMAQAEAKDRYEDRFYKYLDDKYLFTLGMTTNPSSRTRSDGKTYYRRAEDAADRLEFAFDALVRCDVRYTYYRRGTNASNDLPQFTVAIRSAVYSRLEESKGELHKHELRLLQIEQNKRLAEIAGRIEQGTAAENAPLELPPEDFDSIEAYRAYVRGTLRAEVDARS